MKCYSVRFGNEISWYHQSSIRREFLVFAEDITGALLEANDEVERLKGLLVHASMPVDINAGLRILEIREYADVVGRTSVKLLNSNDSDDKDDRDTWVSKLVAKMQRKEE
jgi:hypothetical protein